MNILGSPLLSRLRSQRSTRTAGWSRRERSVSRARSTTRASPHACATASRREDGVEDLDYVGLRERSSSSSASSTHTSRLSLRLQSFCARCRVLKEKLWIPARSQELDGYTGPLSSRTTTSHAASCFLVSPSSGAILTLDGGGVVDLDLRARRRERDRAFRRGALSALAWAPLHRLHYYLASASTAEYKVMGLARTATDLSTRCARWRRCARTGASGSI